MRRISLLVVFLGLACAPGWPRGREIKVLTYNVEFGKGGSAEEFGEALKAHRFDIIGFNEVPGGDWTRRVGAVCGMPYAYVGKTSSANHKDKYKSILSRTPLRLGGDVPLNGKGWGPATAVKATTTLHGMDFTIYSVHIPGSATRKGPAETSGTKAHDLARVLAKDSAKNILCIGDFNTHITQNPMRAILSKGFAHTWSSLDVDLDGEKTWSATSDADEGVIDHILYKFKHPNVMVAGGGILKLDPPLSDHHPVWARFSFGSSPPGGTQTHAPLPLVE